MSTLKIKLENYSKKTSDETHIEIPAVKITLSDNTNIRVEKKFYYKKLAHCIFTVSVALFGLGMGFYGMYCFVSWSLPIGGLFAAFRFSIVGSLLIATTFSFSKEANDVIGKHWDLKKNKIIEKIAEKAEAKLFAELKEKEKKKEEELAKDVWV